MVKKNLQASITWRRRKKLSCTTLRFSFLLYIFFSSTGWGSGSSAEELADWSPHLVRKFLEKEVHFFPKDAFENLRERPGGSTTSLSTFREKSTGRTWIGKSQGHTRGDTMELNLEVSESLACREKIASDIYALYGVSVPQTVLSRQQMTNTGIEQIESQEATHIMSRKVENYHDYKEQFRFAGFITSLDPEVGPVIWHNNRCAIEGCKEAKKEGLCIAYETEGAGKIAAVATWLHDIDFIGPSATNTGYRITSRGKRVIAELIMIDPGESFSDLVTFPYPPSRYFRFSMPGTIATHTIAFERLFPAGCRARDEFLMTLHAIIDTNESSIVRFFTRRGAEFFVSRDPRSAPGLTRQLMERKSQLAIDYAPELEASLSKYEEQRALIQTLINPKPAPEIAIGQEAVYEIFLQGRLIYKPDRESDAGRIDLPIAALLNPLDGTFDLSRCGNAGKYFSISTGYRKGKKAENARKVEIWVVPKFVIEREVSTTARHLAPIITGVPGPIGVIWTLGHWPIYRFDYSTFDMKNTRRYVDNKIMHIELYPDDIYERTYGRERWNEELRSLSYEVTSREGLDSTISPGTFHGRFPFASFAFEF